jgi:hypothetical protein
MKSFKLINTIAGWGAFLFAFIVYLLTLEPSVSFWDCGEFIASSYKLQVGHPPGAPLFNLIGRVVSVFAGNPTRVAVTINAFSAFASAATVMFLYWTIVRLVKKFVPAKSSTVQDYLTIAAGLVGALTFAFTDSFWFSAVEAEVYASSSLFTAAVFWAILRWEEVADEKYSNRWIILIAYLVGLSIGVHLLNLLAIPAIALIWYFKKYKTTPKGIIVTLVGSFIIIALIMWGIIQGVPAIAQKFEILFVNSFGLPFNSGMIALIILILAVIIWLIVYSEKKKKPTLNVVMLSLILILLGYSSYTVIIIRSGANPPMDENNPGDAYSLMKYLDRSQYGKTPLITGYYYNAPAISSEEGDPIYYPKNGKYVKATGQPDYKFDDRFKTFFPRMYSSSGNHVSGYKMWGEIKGNPVSINGKVENIPTFGENLRYFFSYQLNHMYIRYFMWNFSGRQNDNQGYGDVTNGNWLTGIGFIDKIRLGHNGKQPASMANSKTMNRYFMLPFLLGMLGLLYHYRRNRKDFWVVMLLFFMTGIAIVLYLNQTPYQPRERDYAYTGSFYAFAIWIGIGVFSIYQLLEIFLKKYTHFVAMALCAFVPILVLAQNYDDHDRSGRYIAHDLAKNYLNSCDKNAVLFTYGDNDTFPLWYVQDVENVRPDLRICNVTLMNGDWYIDQMKRKAYNSDPLPITMDNSKYANDERNTIIIRDDIKRPIELKQLMDFVLSDNQRNKLMTQGGTAYNFLPSRQIKITVDKQKVLSNKTVSPDMASQIEDSIILNVSGQYLSKSDLAILDLLANNNWERPVYFDLSVVNTSAIKFDDYIQDEGFAYRLVPVKTKGRDPLINTDILYNRLMNQFVWGNINDKRVFMDENSRNTLEVVQIKNNFYSLASKLIEEKKNDKARQVIEKLYSVMPIDKYAPGYYDILIASLWYQLSENGKGDELMQKVADTGFEKLRFYKSLGSDYMKSYQREMSREVSILKELTRIADYSGRKDLVKKVNNELSVVTGMTVS